MKSKILIGFILLIWGVFMLGAVDIPNTFDAGQTASAADVNENFQALADAIDETEYTGLDPVVVDQAARTIGLNPATDPGDVLTWNGTNWIAEPVSGLSEDTYSVLQPYLAVHYIIALQGIYPSRNGADPFIGQITIFAGNFPPRGWAFCDGQLLTVSSNDALFSLLGTIYGGDGITTFALPDLRGRLPMHQGQGPGLPGRSFGEKGGSETILVH